MSVSKLSSVAAIVAAIAIQAGPAQAGGLFNFDPAPGGVYISGFGGGSFLSDATFNGVSAPVAGIPGPTGVAGVPLAVDLSFANDVYFGGSLGFQLPFKYFGIFHPRLEVEVSYLQADIEAGSFNGGNQTFLGDQDTLFIYLNNYSDIVWTENQRFIPYIGGGLGAAFVDSNVQYFPAAATAPVFGVIGEDTAFASHTAIGATYELTDNVELFTEGRYFRIFGARLDRRFISGGADLFNGSVAEDIDGFTLTGGLRFRF